MAYHTKILICHGYQRLSLQSVSISSNSSRIFEMTRSSSNLFDCESSNPFDDHPAQLRGVESGSTSNLLSDDQKRKNPKFRNVLQNLDKSMDRNGVNSSIVAVDVNDENAVVRFLVSNRVYGYPNSNGSILSNYVHFVCNNHPLLSICFARRCHPYDTKKRLIVFICIVSFAIGLSYAFLNTNYVYQVWRDIDIYWEVWNR
jgi:hypothetical protein